jgi:hypothetical protein
MANHIDKLGRQQAIDLAKRMRSKARNADLDAKRLTKRMVGVGSAAGAAYVLGGIMEKKEKEKAENLAAIEAGTAPDPTKLLGIKYDLAVGLGLTAAGLVMQGYLGPKKGGGMLADVVEGAGGGCLSAALYEAGREAASKAEE